MFFTDLETERLILRIVTPADRNFIFAEFTDEDVNRYLFDAEPMQEIKEADDLIALYTEPQPRRQNRWVLVRKEDGAKLGTCGFHNLNPKTRRIEVGYELLAAHRGYGYMVEAMEAILDFARQTGEVDRVDAHIYAANEKSLALAEKLGFASYGETVNYEYRGKVYPHKVLSKYLNE